MKIINQVFHWSGLALLLYAASNRNGYLGGAALALIFGNHIAVSIHLKRTMKHAQKDLLVKNLNRSNYENGPSRRP